MENIYDKTQPHTRRLQRLMTSSEEVDMHDFLRVFFRSDEVPKFANILALDLDLFVKIIRDEVGLSRFMKIFGISDDINTILLSPIMMRFDEIMTHERGYDLASQVLNVCNVHHKKLFCHITYRHLLVLSSDENGCIVLKKVITIADDFWKDEFLDLIAQHAHSLSMHDLGISLIQHVLELDFTKKTTQDDARLHELMAEFDEALSASDIADDQLHKLASKLMLDSDLFFEFVTTRRGSLMIQIILGKSEEIDKVLLAEVKQRFIDVTTDFYGYRIMIRTINAFKKRGDLKVYDQILRLIGVHALYLTKDLDVGNSTVQRAINLHHQDCTTFIACGLQCHYIELSFLKHGSKIVEMLIDDRISMVPLVLIMIEIVKCDEDTLVRLANDEYGNNILKKTLELAKEHRDDFFGDLVDKLNPLLDSLRGSLGENIVAIIDSETETVKDRIVSQGNN